MLASKMKLVYFFKKKLLASIFKTSYNNFTIIFEVGVH